MKLENLIRIENGEKVQHTFSDAEYANRQAKLRDLMARENVDAALFTSYPQHQLLRRLPVLLVRAQVRPRRDADDGQTSISANIDGGQPWRRTVGENVVYTDWQRDNYFRAVAGRCIGCAGASASSSTTCRSSARAKLKAALPDVEFVDISAQTMRMRMVKSAEEIDVIRNGAPVCDVGGAALRGGGAGQACPSTRSRWPRRRRWCARSPRRYPHSELMDTWTWFQSGINTDGAHNPVTTRKVQKGDILSLNCFSMIAGYYTALERTMFFDHCADAHLQPVEDQLSRCTRRARADQAGRALQRHRARAEQDLRRVRPAAIPHVRLRPFVRRALALLRPRGGARTARGHRYGAGSRTWSSRWNR